MTARVTESIADVADVLPADRAPVAGAMKSAAVIPCFRVRKHIVDVVRAFVDRVDGVIVVDDRCPEGSGRLVAETFADDRRVRIIFHDQNQGVGGAMATGYRTAIAEGYEICIKVDGDGQMNPTYLRALIQPIAQGAADYTKGNRFYNLKDLQQMPRKRLFGNTALSFVNKVSSGYWNVMDPTNGYTAIHRTALTLIDFDKVAKRYFFESDMLFRLSTIRAVVRDVAMPSFYGDELSNLRISRVLVDFPRRYLVNFVKRFFYSYILRDMNSASVETIVGVALASFALVSGTVHWIIALHTGELTPLGTIMLVALTAILGTQFLLSAMSFDIGNAPRDPLQNMPGLTGDPRAPEPRRT